MHDEFVIFTSQLSCQNFNRFTKRKEVPCWKQIIYVQMANRRLLVMKVFFRPDINEVLEWNFQK